MGRTPLIRRILLVGAVPLWLQWIALVLAASLEQELNFSLDGSLPLLAPLLSLVLLLL